MELDRRHPGKFHLVHHLANLLGCATAVLLVATAHAAPRSSTAVRQFKAQQPCPATGARRGPCPGYIVDHLVPLCIGGTDHPSNLQWQTVADARVKDRAELAQCRRRYAK